MPDAPTDRDLALDAWLLWSIEPKTPHQEKQWNIFRNAYTLGYRQREQDILAAKALV